MARIADDEETVLPDPPGDGRVRRGRGSLAGVLEYAEDWDSGETNADIAGEFER